MIDGLSTLIAPVKIPIRIVDNPYPVAYHRPLSTPSRASRRAEWLLPAIESPAALDRYIAACQIGITLSSLVLGAYAQATIAVSLMPVFERVGGLQEVAAQSTSTVVVLLVYKLAIRHLGDLFDTTG